MSADRAGATEGPTWYYAEAGEKIHSRSNCPALSSTVVIPANSIHAIPGNRGMCAICVNSGPHPYEGLERLVCSEVPLDLEHVPNTETHQYDARVVGAAGAADQLLAIGVVEIERGTELEIKTCRRRIGDGGSENGYRHGRWRFVPEQHERVTDRDGCYLLCVLEDGQIVASVLAAPAEIDALLRNRWTATSRTNHHDEEARLPWTQVLDPSVLEGGGEA